MISVRTNKYEYAVISSYYDNYIKEHQYDTIKQVVMGLSHSGDGHRKQIKKMHQLLLLCDSSGIDNCNDLLNHFEYITQEKMDCSIKTIIHRAMEQFPHYPLKTILSLLDTAKKISLWRSFFCFVVASLLINKHYNEYVVLPVYMIQELEKVNDEKIRIPFFNGHMQRVQNKEYQKNLLEKISTAYKNDSNYFKTNDITSVYLFGSVARRQDTEFSDIDLVLKLNTSNEDNIKNAQMLIYAYNKKMFDKKSDIHLYEEFVEQNPDLPLLQLI